MKETNKIKAIILVFSLIIFLASFFTGKSIDENLFRWLSGATSAVILIYSVYEKWIWKWPIIKLISEFYGTPVIHGTWKGTLKYEQDASGKPGEIDIYVAVKQTLTTISIHSFVSTSESRSIVATITRNDNGRKQLVYIYRSEAPYGKRETNRPHDGTCVFEIIGFPVKEISGGYFTERKGAGTTQLRKYNKTVADTYEQAMQLSYKEK